MKSFGPEPRRHVARHPPSGALCVSEPNAPGGLAAEMSRGNSGSLHLGKMGKLGGAVEWIQQAALPVTQCHRM
jgi:hypothetical protein